MGRRGSFMAQSLLTKGAKEFDQRNARFPLQATEEELKGLRWLNGGRRNALCSEVPQNLPNKQGGGHINHAPPRNKPLLKPLFFCGGVGVVV